jgi:hypothetical protein
MFIRIGASIIEWGHPVWQRASGDTMRGVMGLCVVLHSAWTVWSVRGVYNHVEFPASYVGNTHPTNCILTVLYYCVSLSLLVPSIACCHVFADVPYLNLYTYVTETGGRAVQPATDRRGAGLRSHLRRPARLLRRGAALPGGRTGA